MSKWIAIRISAGLAMASGIAGLLGALLLGAGLLLTTPRYPSPLPPVVLRLGGALASLVFAGLAVWSLASGMAVFRRRAWARASILVLAAALVLFGLTGILGSALTPLPSFSSVDERLARAVRSTLACGYGLMTVIGAWWLILFSRAPAKRYFSEVQASPIPLSVSVIGWYLLASGAAGALCAVLEMPAPIFGWLATGWAASAVYTLCAALQIGLGSALLELEPAARLWAMVYFGGLAANNLFLIAFPAALRALALQAYGFLRMGLPEDAAPPGVAAAILGALAMLAPVWFLARRRAAFQPPR